MAGGGRCIGLGEALFPLPAKTALPVSGSTSDSVTLIISAVVEMWQRLDDASKQIMLQFGV